MSIRNPQDLLSALPYFLQYQPDDVLVVVLAREGKKLVIITTDVPVPSQEASVWDILAPDLERYRPTAMYLVAYVPEALAAAVVECARLAPVPVNDVLRVHDGRWWGLTHEDPACTTHGTPVQPQDHIVAPFTMAGLSVAASRDDLAASLQPAPTPVLDRVQAELVRGAGEVWTATDRYRALWAAHQARREGPVALGEADAARLLRALSHTWVCDAVMDWHDDATWWLWNDLIRLTPPRRIPTVAALLASSAYQRGDTSLALTAAEHALRADARDAKATAILIGLHLGLTSEEFHALSHTTAAEAREHLRTPPARNDT